MIWAAGGRILHVCCLGVVGVALMVAAVLAEPYRLKRLQAFFFPETDTLGVSYHINQALISFASGGWQGLGLGESRQKLMYLPEAHTDFIFSILGEELGLMGVSVVVVLFVVFVWRGFGIARRSPSVFGALLAYGITAQVGFQAVTNMAVATAMLPTKGLTLPFISYGGSSLLTMGLAVGILLNISRKEPPPAWMHRVFPDGERPKSGGVRRRLARGASR
jgi:cell division protein FtsW